MNSTLDQFIYLTIRLEHLLHGQKHRKIKSIWNPCTQFQFHIPVLWILQKSATLLNLCSVIHHVWPQSRDPVVYIEVMYCGGAGHILCGCWARPHRPQVPTPEKYVEATGGLISKSSLLSVNLYCHNYISVISTPSNSPELPPWTESKWRLGPSHIKQNPFNCKLVSYILNLS